MLTSTIVKSLPRPTDAQWQTFLVHLAEAHSWYKHLPLFNGGEFVVFLAPDAGESYPMKHPKLPMENTTEGYRRAFGHLDYIWRSRSHESYVRDGDSAPHLDEELLKTGRFQLYPYISAEFYWSVHEADVARIRNGAEHPNAAAILEAYDAEQRMDQSWGELSESERNTILGIDHYASSLKASLLNDSILEYLSLEETVAESYCNLQDSESIKLKRCIDVFREWLV